MLLLLHYLWIHYIYNGMLLRTATQYQQTSAVRTIYYTISFTTSIKHVMNRCFVESDVHATYIFMLYCDTQIPAFYILKEQSILNGRTHIHLKLKEIEMLGRQFTWTNNLDPRMGIKIP
ncbi:hypothetical protein ACJX0J_040615 [Zea mays]